MNKHLRLTAVLLLITAVYAGLCYALTQYRTFLASAKAKQNPIVVIDAGHGGEDGGTTSVSGVLEKHINLELALRLEQLLAFAGVETVLVRDTDTQIYSENCHTFSEKKSSDLKNRAALIESTPNALVVSIHQNHFSEEKYSGAQVFYAPTEGSRELADSLQSQLRNNLDSANRRSAKSADSVYLMNHISCTGILIECGFLSNRQEDQLLQDSTYQKKLISVIGCALTQHFTEGEQHFEV